MSNILNNLDNLDTWWDTLSYREKYGLLKVNFNIEQISNIIHLSYSEFSKIKEIINYTIDYPLDFKDE